jgi:hypothetical protein
LTVVGELRTHDDLVLETADTGAIVRQQPHQKLLRAILHPCDVVHHAGALIEHDNDLDELEVVDEQRHGLQLLVVEDLEVLFREVRMSLPVASIMVAKSGTV